MMGYQKYLLKGLLTTTLVVTLSLTAIVWLMQALRLLDYIVNQGVSISLFMLLSALLVPNVVFFVLPVAAFIATMFFYNKLKNDSELAVLQAVGLSRLQLAMPAMMLALVCTLCAYALSLYVLPQTTREYRNMQFFLRNNYISVLLQEGVFATPTDKLMVYIREREGSRNLKGVLVHDMRNPKATVTMMAENATIIDAPTGPQFLLEHGNRQEMREGKLSFLSFDSYPLDISSFAKDNADRREDLRELTVSELFARANDEKLPEKERRRGVAEAHQRLSWPMLPLTLVILSVSLLLCAQHNRRQRIKHNAGIVACACVLTFGAVAMRSLMATTPALTPLAYVLLLAPMIFGFMLLAEKMDAWLPNQRRNAGFA